VELLGVGLGATESGEWFCLFVYDQVHFFQNMGDCAVEKFLGGCEFLGFVWAVS
jgi:hypothetical protein